MAGGEWDAETQCVGEISVSGSATTGAPIEESSLNLPTPSQHLHVMITRCPSAHRMISVGTLTECQKGLYPLWHFSPRLAVPAHHLPRAWAVRPPAISRACVFYGAASGLLGPPNTQFSPWQNFLPAATGHTGKSQSMRAVLCSAVELANPYIKLSPRPHSLLLLPLSVICHSVFHFLPFT